MMRVRAGEVYCPRAAHIKAPAICLTPPPKSVLIQKILDAAAEKEAQGWNTNSVARLLEYLLPPSKKSADVGFLVQVLHLAKPNDDIFARDYVYVRPANFKAAINMPVMDNSDGFFDNLPKLPAKNKKG